MVQMKVSSKPFMPLIFSVYIPHGSDESVVLNIWVKLDSKVYIPHGSDESKCPDITYKVTFSLYPTWFR